MRYENLSRIGWVYESKNGKLYTIKGQTSFKYVLYPQEGLRLHRALPADLDDKSKWTLIKWNK